MVFEQIQLSRGKGKGGILQRIISRIGKNISRALHQEKGVKRGSQSMNAVRVLFFNKPRSAAAARRKASYAALRARALKNLS